MANKFTWDLAAKLLIVNTGITNLDAEIDLYSDAKEDWLSDPQKMGMVFPFDTTGGDPIGAGLEVGAYFFLRNDLGWRIRPHEATHELRVVGNLYPKSVLLPMFVPTVGGFTCTIMLERSSLTQVVMVGSGVTEQDKLDIADRVWEEPLPGAYVPESAGERLGTLTSPVFGSSALNALAIAGTVVTGVETNDFTATFAEDGTDHTIDDVGDVIDVQYEFDIGLDSLPVGVSIVGNLDGVNDVMTVSAWSWAASAWQPIGLLEGTGSAMVDLYSWPLFANHVGTEVNLGRVRVRFAILTGGTNPRLDIDFLYMQYTMVPRSTMFEGQAAGGGVQTITFPATASDQDDFYKPGLIVTTGGTGRGQARRVDAYDGGTRVATVATPWVIVPDATTTFIVVPWASVRVSDADAGALDATTLAANVGAIKAKTDLLPDGVVKNQPLPNFLFTMRDSVDHVSLKAGLTVTARRIIDNGPLLPCVNPVVEVSSGAYRIDFAAADLNGDVIWFLFTAPGADPVAFTIKTQT